ncbi:hypothetical protein PIB30_066928 [Stylosanthes scabra]|uniref:Uncharacterized protein n=1 Tax=Stylosanthes scabra TaxID=79078 RepID=A0ABU6VM84_9FABA|nr:hypothetical protein [Stylosanthes scabra]
MNILHLRASSSSQHFQPSRLLHSDNYTVFNTDDDEDSQSLIRCRFCDLELDFPTTPSETFDPANMVCPVCDEKLGETATKKFLSLKNSRSKKTRFSSGESSMLEKILAARSNQQEPMHSSFFSSCLPDSSAQSRRISHRREDSTSNASDVSSAESSVIGSPAPAAAPAATAQAATAQAVTDEEENVEEKRLRASFAQQLVLSTMF